MRRSPRASSRRRATLITSILVLASTLTGSVVFGALAATPPESATAQRRAERVRPPAADVAFDQGTRLLGAEQPQYGYAEWRGITGGLDGTSYVVTSAADSGPGTYRDALSRGDRYITFSPELDGQVIRLADDITTDASNITVDAAGRDITVSRYATKFEGTNVVVAGMQFRDVTASDNEDAVTFRNPPGEQVFALYGNTFETATDGLVDVIYNEGNDVYGTICGNRFLRHDKAMLIHSGDPEYEGGQYHVTVCQNHWVDVYQRAPFTRDARIHQYNDVFERYGDADGAGGGSKSGAERQRSQHLLQNNIALPRRAGERTWEGTSVSRPRTEFAGPQMGSSGAIRIDGSLLLDNGGTRASQLEENRDEVADPPYVAAVMPADHLTKAAVERHAGVCARNPVRAANPCAPIIDAPGGVVAVHVAGNPASVTVRVDGSNAAAAHHVGGGRWEATVPVGTVGWVDAVVTDHSGVVVQTNRAMVVAR